MSRPPPGDSEFIWQHHGPREIHAHVTRPILLRLAAAGAYSVLDLGCGNGWFTAALDRCGFQVTGADLSESGLRIASREYPDLRFVHHDMAGLLAPSLAGHFDAVVAIDVIDHLPLPRQLIETALAALKPGGLLIVTAPYHGYAKNLVLALSGRLDHRWEALHDHGRVKFFSRRSLLALMQSHGLQEMHFETIGRIPPFARAMLASARVPG